jgi:hypothetical protein
MNELVVKIRGTKDTGGPFTVGDTLTIYEAAMVYSGRHPGGQFVDGTKDHDRASIHEHEVFLGKGSPDRFRELPWDTRRKRALDRQSNSQRKLAWNIYCELLRMVAAGQIKPTERAYTLSRDLDPRDTRIATADIITKLAQARGETPHYLWLWKSRQAPDPSRPRGRVRRKLDTVMKRIEDAFPNGVIPPLAGMSDGKLYQLVTKIDGATPAFSLDTCKRARRELASRRSK